MWALLCCCASAFSGPALAADKLPSGAYLQDAVSVGRWGIRRTTSDEAGRKVLSCAASWTREADLYVHASLDLPNRTFALGVSAIRPPRQKQATMRIWFDDDKAHAIEGPATFIAWSGTDEGEDGYLVLVETGDNPVAAERLAKAQTVTFAYPFDGATRVVAFPYRSARQAMSKLAECAAGR